MKLDIKWSHAIFVFAFLPLVFELTFIGLMFGMLSQIDTSKQLRAREVNAAFESSKFMEALVEQGTEAILAKLGLLGGTKKKFKSGTQAVDRAQRNLVDYLMNDPSQTRFALQFNNHYKEFGNYMRQASARFAEGNVIGSMQMRFRAMNTLQQLLDLSRDFQAGQLEKAFQREQKERDAKAYMQFLIVAFFLLSVLIAGALALLLNKKIVRNLTALSKSAEKLASMEPMSPAIIGNDEFARLDKAFREMAATVSEALDKEKQVVDNASDLICTLDANGVFTSVNPASMRLLGIGPESMTGSPLFQFVTTQQRQNCQDFFQRAKASKEPVSFEASMFAASGKTVDTLWTTSWSQGEQSLFCVVHDISERKQAERLRLELTAMLSHDLRTPITSIQVALDLMSAGVFGKMPDETASKVAQAAGKSLQAMYLINDLLDIEKLETSEIPLFIAAAELRDLIDSALRDLMNVAQEREISVDVRADNVKVFVDKEQFTRVLRNLLSNSIANAPSGTTIEVSAKVHESQCFITIEDCGPVLSEKEKRVFFDRFHDSADGPPKRIQGSGLSLPVCQALIKAHKGELFADTSPDGRFVFSLKIAASQKRPPQSPDIL